MDKWHKTDSSAFYIVLKSNMQWSLGLLPIINIIYNLFYKQFYCHMTQLDKKVMGAPYSYNQGNTKFLQSVYIIICTYETRWRLNNLQQLISLDIVDILSCVA